MHERSHAGIFSNIFIDIGDEQTIEMTSAPTLAPDQYEDNDENCNERSSYPIDEFWWRYRNPRLAER